MTSALLLKLTLFAAIISIAYSLGLAQQCGGDGYGTYPCDAGLACFRRNIFYSSCQYSCPRNVGWDCDVAVPVVSTDAGAWEQCAGDGWVGARACPADYACYTRTAIYSQCRPIGDCSVAAGWSCVVWPAPTTTTTAVPVYSTIAPVIVTPIVLPAYTQCNNVGYSVCVSGTGCFRNNANYSECRYYCPANWACETDVLGANEQCGGDNYVGVTRCDAGLTCYARTKWFAQCAAACPGVDWVC